jgi:hypothetical protein
MSYLSKWPVIYFFITTFIGINHYSFSWYFSTTAINILISSITSFVGLVAVFPHSSTSITNGRLVFYLWCYSKNYLLDFYLIYWIWKMIEPNGQFIHSVRIIFFKFWVYKIFASVAFTYIKSIFWFTNF